MLCRVVKHRAHGGFVLAHDALHAIKSAQYVGGVDHAGPASAHKDILGVVGHAYHLMGHHLADGQNQVVCRVHQMAVDLHRNRLIHQAF